MKMKQSIYSLLILLVFNGCSNNGDMFLCDGLLSTIKVAVNSEEERKISFNIWLGLVADSKDRENFPQFTVKTPIKFKFSFDDKKNDPTFTIKSSDKSLEIFDQNTSPPIRFPPIFETVENNVEKIVYLFKNSKGVIGQKDYEVKKLTFHKETNNIELLFGTWSYIDGSLKTDMNNIVSNRISANCKK
jgi:hypothetical protein